MNVVLLSDEIRYVIWSREPHRRVELSIMLSNDGDEAASLVSYEVLLPEQAVLDFTADSWKLWSTRNVLSTESGQGYGIPAHGH